LSFGLPFFYLFSERQSSQKQVQWQDENLPNCQSPVWPRTGARWPRRGCLRVDLGV